jgi:uncharacterized protein YhaN
VESEWERVCERESELSTRIKKGSRELTAIEVKASALGILEETPRCRSAAELAALEDRIDTWCGKITHEQHVAWKALAIIQEVEREEREKVEDLFGRASRVSELFSEITDGRYAFVDYESETGELFAETPAGDRVSAWALSGGAFDQLYLAIRVSIAERLVGEDRGFFVLDDPFLKADSGRLRNMLEILQLLTEDGWQFIYFTAKDEVVDALRSDIRAGRVELIQMDESPAPSKRSPGIPTPQPLPGEPIQQQMEL